MRQGNLLIELQENWLVLEDKRKEPGGEERTLVLEVAGALRVFQMIDGKGSRCLLFPSSGPGPEDRASAGVKVLNSHLAIEADPGDFTMVRCEVPELGKLFDHLAAEMIDAVGLRPLSPGDTCVSVLGQWRRLLKAVQSDAPNRTELVGVLGEILVAEEIIGRDPERRIDIWVGGENQRHDFRRQDYALEVKTTLSSDSKVVTIHGSRQLEAPKNGSLHLAFVRLESVPSGDLSISRVVSRLCQMGVEVERVYAGLEARGIFPGEWMEERFSLREILYYPVEGSFPRVIPDKFVAGEVPAGVSKLGYSVDLSFVDSPLGEEAADELLKVLAKA